MPLFWHFEDLVEDFHKMFAKIEAEFEPAPI